MEFLLETDHLKKYYGKETASKGSRNSIVKAVDGVSFKIEKGTAKSCRSFSASCNDFEKPNQNFDLVLNKKVNPKRHLKSS